MGLATTDIVAVQLVLTSSWQRVTGLAIAAG